MLNPCSTRLRGSGISWLLPTLRLQRAGRCGSVSDPIVVLRTRTANYPVLSLAPGHLRHTRGPVLFLVLTCCGYRIYSLGEEVQS